MASSLLRSRHPKGGTKLYGPPGWQEGDGVFIHFDTDLCGECDGCGSHGTVMHLLLTRTNGGLHLCEICFGALALAFRLAAGKLRLHDPMASASGK
jgi:hypothetical protein